MASSEYNDEFSDEEGLRQFLDDQENSLIEECTTIPAIATQNEKLNCEKPSQQHLKVLKKYFGHTTFRSLQWQIINSILEEKRDNCAIMSTGYGKSLCYQFPAIYSNGVTLVISPLISLMEDQVYSLKVAKIPACLLGTAQKEKAKVVDEIFENKYSIIYLTPEFAAGEYGSSILERMNKELNVCLIAVDEAHCVSSWGHDFRPKYRKLSGVRHYLPNVPILAVTATATNKVESDIIKSLKLRNPQILHSGFDRPNLYLEVHPKKGASADFLKVMENACGGWKFPGPTIIYCLTRKYTETITELLKSKGVNCAAYHAGKVLNERKEVHEKFLRDQLDVVVATNAFGMGIDKPDIKCVVHYGCPSSMEAYYQEIGRAGRDGEPARCVMFFSESDFQTHALLAEYTSYNSTKEQKKILSGSVRKYLYLTECRRAFILSYFGENCVSKNERCCDICYSKSFGVEQKFEGVDKEGYYDFTEDAEKMLTSIDVFGGRNGLTIYILFLRGSRSSKLKDTHKNHPAHGCGKSKSEDWWKSISVLLLEENYIERISVKSQGAFTNYVLGLTDKGRNFLDKLSDNKASVRLRLKPRSDILEQIKAKPKMLVCSYNSGTEAQSTSKAVLVKDIIVQNRQEELEKKLYLKITEERYKIADKQDCMPHNVISIPDIRELIKIKPKSLKQLEKCKFEMFSEVKIHQFGQRLIDIIVEELGPSTVEDEDGKNTGIVEALLKFPLLEKSSESAEITYNLFKQGKSVQEISEQRALSQGTIFSHLIDCMKKGLPIKLEQMGVDKVKLRIIVRAILETPGNLMTPIKDKCPPHITWNDLKVVLTYYKIRNHLIQNAISYEDFEDFSYESVESEAGALDMEKEADAHEVTSNSESVTTKEEKELDEFLRLGRDIICEDERIGQIDVQQQEEYVNGDGNGILGNFSASGIVPNAHMRESEESKENIHISNETIDTITETHNVAGTSYNKRKCSEIDSESSRDLFDEAFDSPPTSPVEPQKRFKITK